MAMAYQNFASLGVNLNRQKYGPLDISTVFTSEADLQYYLTKGDYKTGVSDYWYKNESEKIVPYPYEGQIIATAINGAVKTYVLALNSAGNFIVKNLAPDLSLLLHFTTTEDANTGRLEMTLAYNDESIVNYKDPTDETDAGMLSFYDNI